MNCISAALIVAEATGSDITVIGFDDGFGDGEAEAGAAAVAALACFGAVEAVEDVGEEVGGDAIPRSVQDSCSRAKKRRAKIKAFSPLATKR